MIKRDDRGWGDHDIFPKIGGMGQINVSETYPGVVRAFHRHLKQYDYWYCLKGNMEVCLFDETAVPNAKVVYLGPNEGLMIEPKIWHGFRVLGNEPVILLYHVTNKYDPKNPDEERAPWNAFCDWETINR